MNKSYFASFKGFKGYGKNLVSNLNYTNNLDNVSHFLKNANFTHVEFEKNEQNVSYFDF